MKRPILVTSEHLHAVIQDQFGLYAAVTRMTLSEMIEQPIPIHCLTRIAAAQFWVPIEGVTHRNHELSISDSNLEGITSIYVTDLSSWIIFIQSNMDKDKAYAWQIYTGIEAILPINKRLKEHNWQVKITPTLKHYIVRYTQYVYSQSVQQHIASAQSSSSQMPTTMQQVVQAMSQAPRFAAQWPPSFPDLGDLQTEIIQQIIQHRIDQTNL